MSKASNKKKFSYEKERSSMFFLHEKVVYPGHGVAKINRIVEKKVSGKTVQFFELSFLNKDMTILIPTETIAQTGIRGLSTVKHIRDMFQMLSVPSNKGIQELTSANWNKRNKEYQLRLRSGNLREIGKVYQDLKCISQYKELSFGEKNLLHQTEVLLAQEISIVNKVEENKAIEYLRSFFSSGECTKAKNHVASLM